MFLFGDFEFDKSERNGKNPVALLVYLIAFNTCLSKGDIISECLTVYRKTETQKKTSTTRIDSKFIYHTHHPLKGSEYL